MTNTQATQSDELFVDITGKWIRGSFLAWYRRYGLDVTGYPITDQFTDTSSGLATQYFQRLVMEEYPPGQIRLKLVGQDALALQQEVASLQDQVADLREQLRAAQAGGGTAGSAIPKPEMQDITDQLPRNPDGFQHRAVDDIHYVVINHTGGPATVAIETLASYHQQRGYPGLAYHYVITGDCAIQQTNPLTDTVSSLGYLGEGVNVAIAGSFDDYAPGDTQLEAAARLCAWLLQELHLTAEAVKGVSEFVTHGSPGWQWLHGSSYKNRLLALIEEVQPEPGQETPPVDGEELARLRAQVSDLQASIQTKEAQIAGLNSQVSALQGQVGERDGRITSLQSQVSQRDQTIADLRAQVGQKDQRIASLQSSLSARDSTIATQKAEISRLQAALEQAQAGGGAGPGPVTKPDIHDVTDQLIKHPTLRYDTRPLKQITHICIHHSAVSGSVSIEAIAEYHVKDRGWPGIGYH
ncbi:MAG: N-acetylmuramoyl-L-alanine amidase, partial [Anaerolineae bacterium]